MVSAIPISLSAALALAAAAAVSDWRTGEIPNWLTLPPIGVAPFAYGLVFGIEHALQCLVAAFLSGLVPYVLFRRCAMGGGDVKLFAALGAITGFDLRAGLEIQLAALGVAMLVSFGALAWKGALLRTLRATVAMSLNPLLPKQWRRVADGELPTPIRMGGPILVATSVFALPTLALAWSGQ